MKNSQATLKIPFKIALYRDKLSTQPDCHSLTWEQFVDFIANYPEESPCTVEDGPARCIGKECPYKSHSSLPDNPMAWSPVDIEGKRLDVNVRFLSLLALDFDHLPEPEAAKVAAALAPYEHVRHTTHSHRSDSTSFRAIFALSRAVHVNQWHQFLATAVDFLDVTVVTIDAKGKEVQQPDRTCKNRSRMYFRPSHPKGISYGAKHVMGKVLDVDEVLAWGAQHRVAMPAAAVPDARVLPGETQWDLQGDAVVGAIDAISRYFPATRRHELALALGGMLRARGATADDARHILFEAFKDGGSTDPDARALTVEHTYSLDADAAMTGFTRVAEILDDEAAEEIGEFLTDASNEAFLKKLRTPGTNGTYDTPSSHVPSVPPIPVDLDSLRQMASALASKRSRSLERDDKINGILIKRVLDSEPIAKPGGVGDIETVRDGATKGVGRDAAIRLVAGSLAFTFPNGTPWEAVAALLRPSLGATHAEKHENWMERAEKIFKRAQTSRLVKEAEKAAEEAAFREKVKPVAPASPTPPPDGSDWRSRLMKGANGSLVQNTYNAYTILKNHEDFCGFIRWNEVAKHVEISGGPLHQYSGLGIEVIVSKTQDYLASANGLTIPHRDLARRIMLVARENPFDPIKDYLNGLQWDGVPRITNWLKTYCGASKESNEYIEKIGRRWLIALVARGLKPGCKVDNVLVLESPPGVGKSTVFETLGGDWFCDTAIDLGNKDSRMLAGSYWICEMAEIVAFKRTGHDVLKSFFSSRIDKFRPPYSASFEETPRRCVWVGTTNEDDYLGDQTGNRKYWPVACVYTAGRTEALQRDRDQLFAEAVVAYKVGEPWFFTYEEIPLTEVETEKRLVELPIGLKVKSWWYGLMKNARPSDMNTLEVFEAALDASAVQAKDGDLIRIGYTLKKMGFIRKRTQNEGQREWRYFATESLMNAEINTRRRGLFIVPGGKTDKDDKNEKPN